MNAQKKKIYLKLISMCAEAQIPEPTLTAFSGLKGSKYKGDLLVVGRAVNGWIKSWVPKEGRNTATQDKMFSKLDKWDADGMNWVWDQEGSTTEYNTRRSAFWRVIKQVTLAKGIAPTEEHWSTSIAWTNLYKFSNGNKGNPSGPLCRLQFEDCKAILVDEIKQLRPKVVLFLAGTHWVTPFISQLKTVEKLATKATYLEERGTLAVDGHSCRYIITPHPQGKPESVIVDEILKAW